MWSKWQEATWQARTAVVWAQGELSLLFWNWQIRLGGFRNALSICDTPGFLTVACSPRTVLPTQLGGGEPNPLLGSTFGFPVWCDCQEGENRNFHQAATSLKKEMWFSAWGRVETPRLWGWRLREDKESRLLLGARLGLQPGPEGFCREPQPPTLSGLQCYCFLNILATKNQPETRRPGRQRFAARASWEQEPSSNYANSPGWARLKQQQ